MKKRKILQLNKFIFIPLNALLLCGCSGLSSDITSSSENITSQESSEDSSFIATLERRPAIKDETVYVSTLSSGQVSSVEIVNRLEDVEPGLYLDYGNYLSASNLTSLSSIVINDNCVEIPIYEAYDNFYYQTKVSASSPLPFNIAVKYYRDNIELQSDEIKGLSGRFKIGIDITPNENLDPYFSKHMMLQLQVPLSLNKHKIISSVGATGVLIGQTMTLAYMSLPGQSSHFEIELETKSFELDTMSASVSYFDLNSLLDIDLAAMVDGLHQLHQGLSNAASGSEQLGAGISELNTYLHEILNGLLEFQEGYSSFNEGLSYLVEVSNTLKNNLLLLVTGFNTLVTQGDSLVTGYAELSAGLLEFFDSIYPLVKYIPTIASGITALREGVVNFGVGLNAYQEGLHQLVDGLNAWAEGYYQFADALPLIEEGSMSLEEGIDLLTTGLATLLSSMDLIPEAMEELSNGLNQMAAGFDEFNTMIEELPLSDEEITLPVSFTSLNNATPHSVQFVYQIKAITVKQ